MRRRRLLLAVLALVALVTATLVAAGNLALRRLNEPYQGFEGERMVVEILPGASARSIFERLAAQGVLRHPLLTRLYFTYRLGSPALQAGEYAFEGPSSVPRVLDKLMSGDVLLYEVTLIEGLTLAETAAHLAERGFGDQATFLARMSTPDLIREVDPLARDLEGYLFPDTYAFARGTPEARIVAQLVATFRQRFETRVLPTLASEPTAEELRDLVILASIVEKEAQIEAERALIAAVYANRLRRGIGLFADPTVVYALKQLGRWDGNIRKRDLEIDSPYNTYRRPGLPPGPIASS